jgi:transposase
LKFNSSIKKIQLNLLIEEYTRCLEIYIEFLWNQYLNKQKVKNRFLKEDQPNVNSFLTARILNSCINHASSIVRSRIEQIQSYQDILNDINNNQNLTQKQLNYKSSLIERLNKMIEIPKINKKEIRIDSKNSKIILEPKISYCDLVVELFCLGMEKFNLILKKHKHFNEHLSNSKLLSGVVINENYIQFNFEYTRSVNKNSKSLGVDIGINSCLTTSDNKQISLNDKGKPYHIIMEEIVRKRKGSKSFNKKLKERDNCSNYCVKKLDWSSLSEVCIEDIKNLRKGKTVNKIRRHWNYRLILDSLKSNAEIHNVYVNLKNPMYTSQRCSECGYVNDKNRNNEIFICLSCGFATNADYNASINLSTNLHKFKRSEIPKGHKFFWDCSGIRLSGEESEAPLFTKKNILI